MNYPFTSIDGKTYDSMNTSRPQTSITNGQLIYLLKEIKLQQAGEGVQGARDPYWNNGDYPGTPVWKIR